MGDVVVVGSLNMDLIAVVPRLPRPGETVTGGRHHRAPGGKGANAAAAAATLGARTSIVGVVGDDDLGRATRENLAALGVDLTHLHTGAEPTGVALILVDERGENCIAVASGANQELTADHVQGSLEAIDADGAIVLSNLEIPLDAVAAAARHARSRAWRFVLNPAPAREIPDELIGLCDVITPNQHEVDALGGIEATLAAGAGAVVVTRGAEGADVHRSGRDVHHQEAFTVDAVDTTGAGDAFSATLAWALSEGRSLEEAVRLAAAGGALAARAVGARSSLADRDELEAFAGPPAHPA